MKRAFLLILLPSVSFGANISPAQVQAAKNGATAIIQCGIDILKFVNGVDILIRQNFEVGIVGSTETVALSQAQKDRVIDTSVYQAKKQACVDAFNTLP